MLAAECHCGAIRIEVDAAPEFVVDCNCSICRRLGALWAFYPWQGARITGATEHGQGYIWGAKTISTFHCRRCGCATHWEPLAPRPDAKFAINARMLEPAALAGVRLRRFDGADTWAYLD